MQHPIDTREPRDSASASATTGPGGPLSFLRRLGRELALQDIVIGVYLTLLMSAVLAAAKGPDRADSIMTVVIDIVAYTIGITLTRGAILRPGSFANGFLYRMTVFFPVLLTYFQLRSILPAVSPHSLDGDLLAFDMRVFGFEPAVSWDRFVTPHTTEWFAFFYFGYFFLLAAHVLPIMLASKSVLRISHFALGVFTIFCTGQLLYMLVPGWGPYHYLAGQFTHPLEGGLFWRLVRATVDAGGSQKDIFPSLHTAVPTFFALYQFIHRRTFPFRFTWPFMAFGATQIIIATMFLRWHYLIDIVAGITIATTAALVSHRVVTWEMARRKAAGVRPIFTVLEWRQLQGNAGRRGDEGDPDSRH